MLWPGTFQMRKSTLLSFPSGSGRLPTKRVQMQVARSYKRRVKRKVKPHGRYLWHLSPRLERGQTEGREQDCQLWDCQLSPPAEKGLTCCPPPPICTKETSGSFPGVLCHHNTAVSCAFQEIKFEVAQPC